MSDGSLDSPAAAAEGRVGRAVRRVLAAAFLLGTIGTFTELLFLGHTEGAWQYVPIVLLAVGLLMCPIAVARRPRLAVRGFQALMVLFLGAGLLGVALHSRGNVEFELEMYPTLKGFELARKVLTGATPVLAPGAMAQLGLVGIALSLGRGPTRAPRRSAP